MGVKNALAEARRRQRSWAHHARRLERARTWRVGRFLSAALRLLTLRRATSRGGLGDLAASIESSHPAHKRSIPARPDASTLLVSVGMIFHDAEPFLTEGVRSGRIHGLVDFDAVAQGPRIVDFQNALAFALIAEELRPNRDLVDGFASGFCGALPLSPHELALVYPVMLDRIAWLIANIRRGDPRQEAEAPRSRSDSRDRTILLVSQARRAVDPVIQQTDGVG